MRRVLNFSLFPFDFKGILISATAPGLCICAGLLYHIQAFLAKITKFICTDFVQQANESGAIELNDLLILFLIIVLPSASIVGSLIWFNIKLKRTNNSDFHTPLNLTDRYSSLPSDTIDSQNIPFSYTVEECDTIRNSAAYHGKRYVTQKEIDKYVIHKTHKLFASMPGWDIWDVSIHETSGQLARMKRANEEHTIEVLCYDPEYSLGKVQGKTGIYLTSCKRCSCPDFYKRRLPCKHMYALAYELNGDVDFRLLDTIHKPLYGLTLALAGRLPRKGKNSEGIRAQIERLGGKWSENIEPGNSAVVVGTNPSQARLDRISEFDIEALAPESIESLFASYEVKYKLKNVSTENNANEVEVNELDLQNR